MFHFVGTLTRSCLSGPHNSISELPSYGATTPFIVNVVLYCISEHVCVVGTAAWLVQNKINMSSLLLLLLLLLLFHY